MDNQKRSHLRKKQLIYTNLLFLLYGVIIFSLIFSGMTSRVIYLTLGVLFLISPISLLLRRSPNPFLYFLPDMKEILTYEKEKLGKVWYSYYTSSMILHIAISIFFFIQAWYRQSETPFVIGIPVWYFIVIPIILLALGNWNQSLHMKRIDQKTYEELQVQSYEKRLFAIVFAITSIIITVIAIMVIQVMTNITPQ